VLGRPQRRLAVVTFEFLNPRVEVGRRILELNLTEDSRFIGKECCSQFGNQFFPAIRLGTESCGESDALAIEAREVPAGMGLMPISA
jgi:hypothetical protein